METRNKETKRFLVRRAKSKVTKLNKGTAILKLLTTLVKRSRLVKKKSARIKRVSEEKPNLFLCANPLMELI